jgi:hypothetical protein
MKATRAQFARRKKFLRSKYVGMRRIDNSQWSPYPRPPYWQRIERRGAEDWVHTFSEEKAQPVAK